MFPDPFGEDSWTWLGKFVTRANNNPETSKARGKMKRILKLVVTMTLLVLVFETGYRAGQSSLRQDELRGYHAGHRDE